MTRRDTSRLAVKTVLRTMKAMQQLHKGWRAAWAVLSDSSLGACVASAMLTAGRLEMAPSAALEGQDQSRTVRGRRTGRWGGDRG